MKSIITPFLLTIALCGCTKDGLISKEGVYESLKSINKTHNPSISPEDEEEMNYRDYEMQRQEQMQTDTESDH